MFWFQVPVNDPGRVCVGEGVRDLLADLRHPRPRQASGRLDLSAQRPARDELHHDPWRAVMLDDIMDRDHPRMAQPGRGPGLTGRPGHQLGSVDLR